MLFLLQANCIEKCMQQTKILGIFFFLNLCFIASVFSQKRIPVFISGEDGYKTYRIPAIIKAPNNDLLAFCEGRVASSNDFGNVDIVMKRSTDQGKTWSKLDIIVNNDSLQAGNSAPVLDLYDPEFPEGKIYLFYNTGNNHEGEVRKGNGLREVWFKTSTNNGMSWSDPVNITLKTHRPKYPSINVAYNFTEDWRSYANTPGHALQIQSGIYKGRIFIAANHSEGPPKNKFQDYYAHAYYSDDHGKTFHLSESLQISGSNEATAAALSNGKLILNTRNQQGDKRNRIISISNNGGMNWDTTYFDENLPDPVCQGSLLNIGRYKNKEMLAFINAADTKNRNNLTLRISKDEGLSWFKNIIIDKTNEEKQISDYTAYSDLVLMKRYTLGVIYEKENYSKIVFTIVDWEK